MEWQMPLNRFVFGSSSIFLIVVRMLIERNAIEALTEPIEITARNDDNTEPK